MKVLFVSKPIAPPFHDGAKCLVRDVATHLERAEPTVLTTKDAPPIGPRVRHEAIYPGAGAFAPAMTDNARVVARLLAGSRHDLWHFVFAPNPLSSMVAKMTKNARRAKTLQTVASAPRKYEHVERLLLGDRVVCLTSFTRDAFVRAGADPKRFDVIPPPLGDVAVPSDEDRARARRDASLPPEAPLVVYPGDLELSNGARAVSDAIPPVLAAVPDAVVVFACRAKTERARERETELRRELAPFGARVAFVGEVASLPALVASARVVVFPVDDLYGKVDLPIALLESMALGVPVVALREGPLSELEGVSFIGETKGATLAALTTELLEDDRAHRDASSAGKAAVSRKYRASDVARAYEDVYARVVGALRKRASTTRRAIGMPLLSR